MHIKYAFFMCLNFIAKQYSAIDTPNLNVEKRMKKIQLAIITAGMIGMSATAVNAQSKFEGFYGQVGVGYESVAPSYSNSNFTVTGVGTAPINTSISNSNGFTDRKSVV
jgi:hypothetical protein